MEIIYREIFYHGATLNIISARLPDVEYKQKTVIRGKNWLEGLSG